MLEKRYPLLEDYEYQKDKSYILQSVVTVKVGKFQNILFRILQVL